MSEQVRVCTDHGATVEAFSGGRWLCPSKVGRGGHKQHVVTEVETRLYDPARF